MKCFPVLVAAVFLFASGVCAEEAAIALAPGKGEIRLDGTLELIDAGAKTLVLSAQTYTLPSGKTGKLLETKPKLVVLSDATILRRLDASGSALTLNDLKIGIATTIVGRDLGSGRELPARIVAQVDKGKPGGDTSTRKVRVSAAVADLNAKGHEALAAHRYTQALEFFGRAETQAGLSNDSAGQVLSLNNMAFVYARLQQPQKARELYQKTLDFYRLKGDRDGEISALANLAFTYNNAGEFDKAVELAKHALQMAREQGDASVEAHSLLNLALFSGNLETGREEELAYLQQALAIWQRLENRDQQRETLIAIGRRQSILGKFDEALTTYQRALELAEEGKSDADRGDLHNLMGVAWSQQGEYEKAAAAFERALPLRRDHGTKEDFATTLRNLAFVQSQTRQFLQATETLQQVLPLLRELKDKENELYSWLSLAEVRMNLKQQAQAVEALEQALLLARELKQTEEAAAIQKQLELLRRPTQPDAAKTQA